MPATKSLRSGTWASTLLPSSRSAATRRAAAVRGRRAEELDARRDPLAIGDVGHVRRRLDAQHRDPGAAEVLQQVAVVARDLDDQARRAQPELRDHPRRSGGSARPSCRVRTRSRRSRRRSPRGSRTARAGPASSARRRTPAAGRSAPSRWPARPPRSCWRAESCRDRRRRARRCRAEAAPGCHGTRVARGPSASERTSRRKPFDLGQRQRVHVGAVRVARRTTPPCRRSRSRGPSAAASPAAPRAREESSCRYAPRADAGRRSISERSSAGPALGDPLDDPATGCTSSSPGPKFQPAASSGSSHSACARTRYPLSGLSTCCQGRTACRVAHAQRLAGERRAHQVGDQAVLAPVAAADHVARAGRGDPRRRRARRRTSVGRRR